ncbi:MFS transporter [Pseudonocardia sp. ICBG1034]|uniref:MFS transporter n=1 Tax=Pseudonocardia sp. ICBG1034 TaxID=2844381 RepID=UPI001CCD34B0|nr:MFS transporter [Pseudonocardia sp. ICBG1034]
MDEKTLEPTAVELLPGFRRRAVLAIGAGNLLEWYDFAVYASLAGTLGVLFFSSESPLVALLATFSVFAVGYVARPVGAVVFGRLADKRGRKIALVLVITLMGVATVLVGLMPTYETIGVLAPILLSLARIAQGISVGGEFSTSISYLVEIAPTGRRGIYGSVAYLTACLGFGLGLAVVYLLNGVLGAETLLEWGWRIPFLLSFPLLLIGMYLRRRTTETPAFATLQRASEVEESPLRSTLRSEWRPMTRLFGMMIAFAVSSYTVLAFVLSFLLVVQRQPASLAYSSVLVATGIGSLMIPFFGALSDRVGRRPVLLAGAVGLIVLALPGYLLMSAGEFWGATLGQLLIWLPVAVFCGVFPAAYCELFPTRRRSTAVGLPVALGTAIFSGTTPLVSTLLIESTGSVVAPAWYLISAAVVSMAFLWGLRETADGELDPV